MYPVRPFSCRLLYSVRQCGATGPVGHRQVWGLAESARHDLHLLDETGYSGHLSYILQLLSDPNFKQTYLAGRFEPDIIEDFARTHGILINRFAEPGAP